MNDNDNVIHTHPFTKKEILPFTITWMKLEDIILSETIQAQKKKYCLISLMFRI
jgi:hypothetical protein